MKLNDQRRDGHTIIALHTSSVDLFSTTELVTTSRVDYLSTNTY